MNKLLRVALLFLGILSLAAPAAAAPKVTLGARVIQEFGWQWQDQNLTQNGHDSTWNNFVQGDSNTYLRAKLTSEDQKLGVLVELGPTASIYLRHAYGWYRAGHWRFQAGQTNTQLDLGGPLNQQLAQAHLRGFGHVMVQRVPNMAMTWKSGAWGLQAALLRPRQRRLPTGLSSQGVDLYSQVPGLGAVLTYTAGGFTLGPSVSFYKSDFKGAVPPGDDYWLTWFVKLPLKMSLGAWSFTFEIHYGANFASEYMDYPDQAYPVYTAAGKVEDTRILGGNLSARYSFSQDLALAAGFGLERLENDAWRSELGYTKDSLTRWAAYLDLTWKLHRNLTLHPELLYFDYGDDPADGRGSRGELLAGLQIVFLF